MVDFVCYGRGDARTFDLYDFANGTARYSNQTPTSFQIDYFDEGANKTTYIYGQGFVYFTSGPFAGAPSAGRTTSATNFVEGILNATVTGLDITQAQAFQYISWQDSQRVAADVFKGNDTITGSVFDDYLDGWAGADTFRGGAGNDTYLFDNARDRAFEDADNGIDTVLSSVTHTLAANIENLTLTGSSNLSGTGNELDNVITGNAGRNNLVGGAGNDTLNGGGDADRLIGGLDDDTYIVNNAGVSVVEAANEGTDAVITSLNYVLGANIENLTLTGSANLYGTGNALNNTITGNAGSNVLSGGDGNDVLTGFLGSDRLTGGAGSDTFVFNAVQDSTFGAGRDLIIDFAVSADDALADKLDFRGIGSFEFIDSDAFSALGVAELHTVRAGGNTVVEGDFNGDGAADFSVLLRGVFTLADNNFVL